MTAGLTVSLEVAPPVVVGLSVLAIVRATNCGDAPVSVSARLNLMEGDLHLTVTGPDGSARGIRGYQADTALRQATLGPREQLVGAINLLWTDIGPTFPEPGSYRLRAEYFPSPKIGSVRSEPVSVVARGPKTDAEREAAALLEDATLREALIRGRADDAPDQLRALAACSVPTPDADLAHLLVHAGGADSGDALDSSDPIRRATLIMALSTPYSNAGRRLADQFVAQLGSGGSPAGDTSTKPAAVTRRVRGLLSCQPVPAE